MGGFGVESRKKAPGLLEEFAPVCGGVPRLSGLRVRLMLRAGVDELDEA